MARTTISIPDDLREAMDATENSVNWSALAADAFRTEINRINSRKAQLSGANMDAVVSRLKSSKQRYRSHVKARGERDGTTWAKHYARFENLKALSANWDVVYSDYDAPLEAFLNAAGFPVTERRQEGQDLMVNLDIDKQDGEELDYWIAFSEAAVEVFKSVEDALEA